MLETYTLTLNLSGGLPSIILSVKKNQQSFLGIKDSGLESWSLMTKTGICERLNVTVRSFSLPLIQKQKHLLGLPD